MVHLEVIGKDPDKLRSYHSELFGGHWHSRRCGERPEGYDGHVAFYVELPDVEAALVQAESRLRRFSRGVTPDARAGLAAAPNLTVVAYTTAQERQQLLDGIAEAADELAGALASLGEAYERLDEQTADRLEEELFRPLQMAYGRAQRTHAEFAARHGLAGRAFEQATPGAPSQGVRGFVDSAIEAVGRADSTLATLQDSMLPVEVGDADLRAGLEEVRKLVGDLRGRARELVRVVGR